jgi:hypothetical protein
MAELLMAGKAGMKGKEFYKQNSIAHKNLSFAYGVS